MSKGNAEYTKQIPIVTKNALNRAPKDLTEILAMATIAKSYC